MGTIRRFEELRAWQSARQLVREVYELCGEDRMRGDFPLRDQLSRAALAAMNNIAEGFGRYSDREFAQFLTISLGSLYEVQSLLHIARDLERIAPQRFARIYALADETAAKVARLASYLRNPAGHQRLRK